MTDERINYDQTTEVFQKQISALDLSGTLEVGTL